MLLHEGEITSMKVYKSVICDECGTIRKFCENLTDSEIENILKNCPEWRLNTIEEDSKDMNFLDR